MQGYIMKIKRVVKRKAIIPTVKHTHLEKFKNTELVDTSNYKGVSGLVVKQFLGYLKIDLTISEAAIKVGLNYDFVKSMIDNNVNGFGNLVDQAQLAPKIHHLQRIHLAKPGWKASAWWLERAIRERYGKEVTIRRTEDDKQTIMIGKDKVEF